MLRFRVCCGWQWADAPGQGETARRVWPATRPAAAVAL